MPRGCGVWGSEGRGESSDFVRPMQSTGWGRLGRGSGTSGGGDVGADGSAGPRAVTLGAWARRALLPTVRQPAVCPRCSGTYSCAWLLRPSGLGPVL